MVYGTQITIVNGAYKPTNITGGGTLYDTVQLEQAKTVLSEWQQIKNSFQTH